MVGIDGTQADPGVLARVREGRVGAVILFPRNIVSPAQVSALTAALQVAAHQGGNPPLLIAVDQEGGQVRRFASGPPSLSPPQIAATASAAVAFRQGQATGRIPRGLDAVMLSIGGFSFYDPSGTPAALSQPIVSGLLRGRLKFGGVTITDSLGASTGHDEITAGVLAAQAGADMLLYTDSAAGVLSALRQALSSGSIARGDAEAAYRRIVALKSRVADG